LDTCFCTHPEFQHYLQILRFLFTFRIRPEFQHNLQILRIRGRCYILQMSLDFIFFLHSLFPFRIRPEFQHNLQILRIRGRCYKLQMSLDFFFLHSSGILTLFTNFPVLVHFVLVRNFNGIFKFFRILFSNIFMI